MADFYQTGVVATFHRFGKVDLERMESELTEFNRQHPIALVLPATYTELEAPAIKKIVEEIKK
ncbi:MAG: glycosyl transferase, partial [Deltaproteobacteria bacterium]|nr:glycosyl transferase [Deltaproteobacteria bacterium]